MALGGVLGDSGGVMGRNRTDLFPTLCHLCSMPRPPPPRVERGQAPVRPGLPYTWPPSRTGEDAKVTGRIWLRRTEWLDGKWRAGESIFRENGQH